MMQDKIQNSWVLVSGIGCLFSVTKFIEHTHSWEANGSSACKEIPSILCTLNVDCHMHMTAPLVRSSDPDECSLYPPILFIQESFYFLPYTPDLEAFFLLQVPPTKSCRHLFSPPCMICAMLISSPCLKKLNL